MIHLDHSVHFIGSFPSLFSCVAQWTAYQDARQTVIELMNEAEQKLTEFSTAKAATAQEAEEKLRSHKVRSDSKEIISLMMYHYHTVSKKTKCMFFNFRIIIR